MVSALIITCLIDTMTGWEAGTKPAAAENLVVQLKHVEDNLLYGSWEICRYVQFC